MDQFNHLPEFRLIICRKCNFAVLPSHINAHFARKPHELKKEICREIENKVAYINGLILNKQELKQNHFPFSPAIVDPILALQTPRTNKKGCSLLTSSGDICTYVSSHLQEIQEYYRNVHRWDNLYKKGRISALAKQRGQSEP